MRKIESGQEPVEETKDMKEFKEYFDKTKMQIPNVNDMEAPNDFFKQLWE